MALLKFDDTTIKETIVTELSNCNLILAHQHVIKVLKSLGVGLSNLAGRIKNMEKPVSIAFTKLNGDFLMGAKVEYHKNPDDPENPASGNWSYVLTFNEDDLEGTTPVKIDASAQAFNPFSSAALKLFNMKFPDYPTGLQAYVIIIEKILQWMEDNAKESEVVSLDCDVFTVSCEVKDNIIVKSIVPSGDLKILIKNDDMYQENV